MSRKVKVVTLALDHKFQASVDGNRKMVAALFREACRDDPDIVCLPENFPTSGVKGALSELAESVPGPTTDLFGAIGREYRTYLVCPLIRRHRQNLYNSAVILDRKGEVAGINDKLFIPNTSWGAFKNDRPFEFDVVPGKEASVFDLDFGRIGVQICFDLSFRDGWEQLADRGAELVFWPSAFNGGLHLRAMASLYNYYVVSSVRTSHAQIINPIGEVLVKTGCAYRMAAATLDLDFLVCYFDWHLQRIKELKEKFGSGISIRVAQDEGLILFEASGDDLSISKIQEDLVLESCRSFHRRHAEQLKALRTPAG